MEFPKYADITIYKRVKLSFNDDEIEYYQREGFKEEQLKNILERDIRDNIWRYIDENNITITIE